MTIINSCCLLKKINLSTEEKHVLLKSEVLGGLIVFWLLVGRFCFFVLGGKKWKTIFHVITVRLIYNLPDDRSKKKNSMNTYCFRSDCNSLV